MSVFIKSLTALRNSVHWHCLLGETEILLPNYTNILSFKSNLILGLSGNMQEDYVPWVSLWCSYLCVNRITCCKVPNAVYS